MDHLSQDLRQAFRLLRATPGPSLLAILTLAIGIGANATMFSAVSALILRPLPIPDSSRVVFGVALREGFDPFGTSLLDYIEFRRSVPELAASGLALSRSFNLIDRDDAERVVGAEVTASYLATLDVQPAVGRRFSEDDDRPGAPAIALVGDELWRRRFNGRPDVIGQTLVTDEGVLTIVGVMPRGFDQPGHSELWLPARRNLGGNDIGLPMDQRIAHAWGFVARLRPGADLTSANASLRAAAARLEREYPQYRRGWSYKAVSLRRELVGDIEGRSDRALAILLAAVGCLLIICCANVAGLLLVRGVAREREFAVRLALGAGRSQLVRQLAVESAVLAALAGVAGLLVTYWTVPIVAALSPVRAQALGGYLTDFRVDARVVLFTVAASALSALLFGIAPALRTLGARDLSAVIRRREHRTTVDAGGRRVLNGLVVAEITIAAALLVGGSLLVQSFDRLRQIDLGFRPEKLLTMETALAPAKYPTPAARVAFVERLLSTVRSLPGVEGAGVSTNLPLDDLSFDSIFTVEGRPPQRPSDVPITAHRMVTAGYLETIGVRLRQGRLLDERDRADTQRVVVVTEEFARQAWPGDPNPIGRRVRRGAADQIGFPWLTVVGIVSDTKEDQFNFRIARPAWYLPYSQVDSPAPLKLALRTGGDPTALAASVRQALTSLDPAQPISAVRTMDDQVAVMLVRDRFSAALIAALAAIGIVLAIGGLYGVIAYTVSQRRGELGLRLALGAAPRDVLVLVLRQGASLVAVGLATGLLVARALGIVFASVLYDVRPGDPWTFAAVALALASIGLLACYLPARRAGRIDPAVALRE